MDKNIFSNNYINKKPISLLAEILKINCTQVLENYIKDNNIDSVKSDKLKKLLLKTNEFYPIVVQKKSKENLQVNIFN